MVEPPVNTHERRSVSSLSAQAPQPPQLHRERSKSLGVIETGLRMPQSTQWPHSIAQPWRSSPTSPRRSTLQPSIPVLNVTLDNTELAAEFTGGASEVETPQRQGPVVDQGTSGSVQHSIVTWAAELTNLSFDPRVALGGGALQALQYSSNRDTHFYHFGRVFVVSPRDKDAHLAGRTMIVLAPTDHGAAVCLSLCRHPDVSGREDHKFFRSHLKIAVFGSPQSQAISELQRRTIKIILTKGLAQLDNVWVNCQLPWTVQMPAVAVADAGYLQNSDWKTLNAEYLDIQTDMLARLDPLRRE